MDNDAPAHRKKKPSDKSKSESRSDHKHEYEPCIVKFLLYGWNERCVVCGRIRGKGNREKNRELLRPESVGKPAIGLQDYLSVAEMKEKYPGVRVYEWYLDDRKLKIREMFE